MDHRATLSIVGGRHRGGMVEVPASTDAGPLLLGSSADCDIILTDADVAPRHALVEFDRPGVAVTAREGDVVVRGRGEIAAGFRACLDRDSILEIGGASVALALARRAADAPARRRARGPRFSLLPCIVAASVCPSGIVSDPAGPQAAILETTVLAPKTMPASRQVVPAAPEADAGRRPPGTADAPAPPPGTPEALIALRAELDRQGLEILRIARDGTGLSVSGALSADQRPAWRGFRTWADSAYPQTYLNVSDVRFVEASARPRLPEVQSVWMIGTPKLMVDGYSYEAGDDLPGGWRIVSIAADHAVLSADGGTVRMVFAGHSPASAIRPNDDPLLKSIQWTEPR